RPEEVAAVSVIVLRACGSSPAEQEKVAEQIRAACLSHPKSAPLYLCLAELEMLRNRYDAVVGHYRKVLELQPNNLAALNNTAYYLSLKEQKPDEAVEMINQVLAAMGPVGEFLDPRGLVLLGAGKPSAAAKDFEAALRQLPSPLKHFHLAQAQLA